jgi:AcrR family transcriptional regulator
MSRAYDMTARAALSEARREKIVEAATALFLRHGYDEVSLQEVADLAAVALKTVVRQFGSKEALLVACAEVGTGPELARRTVPAGDLPAAVRALADRYEEIADATLRVLALEDRMATVKQVLGEARAMHLEWLTATFAPFLPVRGAVRERRLAALFGATEILVWWTWRRRLGLDRAAAEAAMLEMLMALCARWGARGR